MYIASIDSLHKTQCLNELRKMTFEDYGVSKMEKHKHGKFRWVHLRHFVDMLMQDQLCHADADMITFITRSWDQLMELGRGHVLDPEKMKGLEKPPGVTELPFERGYYEMFDFEDSAMYPNGAGYEW